MVVLVVAGLNDAATEAHSSAPPEQNQEAVVEPAEVTTFCVSKRTFFDLTIGKAKAS